MHPRDEKIFQRHRKILNLLRDPTVAAAPQRVNELNRELRQISARAEKIAELERVEHAMAEANRMVTEDADAELVALAQGDLAELEPRRHALLGELEALRRADDPLFNRNLIMEIRAGAGGEEAALFSAELYRCYSRYAESQGWKVNLIEANRTELGGYKSVVYKISGSGAYGALRYESGTHRVQRVPATEKSGRVHTSTATVAVLPEADEVDVEIKPEELRIDVFRSGGHGGQSVNTTDSAVRITHQPTGLVVTCQDERSQLQNKVKALTVLRTRLFEMERERQERTRGQQRRSQIGSGDRAEKIRTYNFPQDRLTDHRIKRSWHGLKVIMDGGIGDVIAAVQQAAAEQRDED